MLLRWYIYYIYIVVNYGIFMGYEWDIPSTIYLHMILGLYPSPDRCHKKIETWNLGGNIIYLPGNTLKSLVFFWGPLILAIWFINKYLNIIYISMNQCPSVPTTCGACLWFLLSTSPGDIAGAWGQSTIPIHLGFWLVCTVLGDGQW